MCVCVCVSAYICVYIYIYIHIYICIYIYVRTIARAWGVSRGGFASTHAHPGVRHHHASLHALSPRRSNSTQSHLSESRHTIDKIARVCRKLALQSGSDPNNRPLLHLCGTGQPPRETSSQHRTCRRALLARRPSGIPPRDSYSRMPLQFSSSTGRFKCRVPSGPMHWVGPEAGCVQHRESTRGGVPESIVSITVDPSHPLLVLQRPHGSRHASPLAAAPIHGGRNGAIYQIESSGQGPAKPEGGRRGCAHIDICGNVDMGLGVGNS